MIKNLQHVIAIARVEFRFGIRRGGPVVGMAAVGLIVTMVTLFVAVLNVEGLPRSFGAKAGARALAEAWPAFEWLALGLLPIVTAPAIPLDRQYGVSEILRSLPLTGSIYLAGKVLGTVSIVALTGVLTLVLHVFLHWVLLGPLQTGVYLELTLLSGLPLSLWAATIGILMSCGLRTRRAAIFAGVSAGIVGPYIWNASSWFTVGLGRSVAENRLTYQAASKLIFSHYNLLPSYVPSEPGTGSQALQSIIIAYLALLGLAVAARLWLLWKEDF